MGDTSLHSTYADFQQPHFATSYLPPQPPALNNNNNNHHHHNYQDTAVSPGANGDDEPYTIRCICGYSDDDGNTVLCEKCNTWQHISCYYHPKEQLEDDFHHICADCSPRREGELDRLVARQRQRRLREPINSDDRKSAKRAPTKPRKSKTKDANGATNGWTLHDASARDGSPREQGPPAKRSKTSHKASPSLNNFRNRSGSHLLPVHSIPPPLSICPSDWFSSDFIRVHRDNTSFEPTDTNISVNIAFSGRLGEWLDHEDQFAADTNGRTHKDVFQRLAVPFEDVHMPQWEVKSKEDRSAQFHGEHPIWKYVELQDDLRSGQILGELTGSIGPREEYQADSPNRWDVLRHPDHFVFFHPVLPLYVDCRNEGTALRYVRRSCRPNLQMNTFITGERDIRFVFTAVEDIPAGSEVTVGWDTTGLQQYGSLEELAKSGGQMDMSTTDYLSEWAQTLLAHFGGCPCDKHAGPVCLMDHFDRRIPKVTGAADGRSAKNGKKRKASRKDSPLPDHLTSRASSEAIARDEDDDIEDARSTTHSGDSENSRDATPNGHPKHFDHGLSEREKKKLMQQERLFEQMEHMEQHGPKKKKRPSGSNANTPTVETSKQISRPFAPDSFHPSSKPRTVDINGHRRMTNGNTPPRPGMAHQSTFGQTSAPAAQRRSTRAVYVDASTQTEKDKTSQPPAAPTATSRRKPRVGLVKKLFRKSLLRHMDSASPCIREEIMQDVSEFSPRPTKRETPAGTSDVDSMEGVVASRAEDTPENAQPMKDTERAAVIPRDIGERVVSAHQTSHPPIKPPPPPWNPGSEPRSHTRHQDVKASRSPNLHVDLPPPSFHGRQDTETPGTSTTPGVPGHVTVPSPVGSELMSPPVLDANVTKPTPIKKKMSLSDYTKRRKTETPQVEKTQSQAEGGDFSRMSSEGAKSPSVERAVGVKQEEQQPAGGSSVGGAAAAEH